MGHDAEGGNVYYDPALLAALKELRTALRGLFSALIDGQAPTAFMLAVINDVLRTGNHALDHASDNGVSPVYRINNRSMNTMLFPIALTAVEWFRFGDRSRLQRYANTRCGLLFYDTTKSATRRWCSLSCMDQACSAQRYRQAKHNRTAEE